MAEIHEAIYNRLSNWSALSSLLTVGGVMKLYHGTLPQNTTVDAVVYTVFTPRHIQDFQGRGGLAFSILQTDIFSNSANRAAAIRKQIRLAMQGMPAGTYAGVYIHSALAREEIAWPWDPEELIYRITQEFEVCHNEDEPT